MKRRMNLKHIETLFFDFDGVIVDSLDIKTQAFGELFRDYGEDIVKKVMYYHMNNSGVSRYEKFKYYYSKILHKEISQDIMNDLNNRFSQLVLEKVVKAPTVAGVIDFLKKLNNDRKNCFVVSATPQDEIRHIAKLKQLDGFFKEIVGSPMTKKENLRHLVNKYALDRTKAIYCGDAKSDYEAAVENNIDFIGVGCEKNAELSSLPNIPKIKNFLKEKGQKCKII